MNIPTLDALPIFSQFATFAGISLLVALVLCIAGLVSSRGRSNLTKVEVGLVILAALSALLFVVFIFADMVTSHNTKNQIVQSWVLEEFGVEINGYDAHALISGNDPIAIQHDGKVIVVSLVDTANDGGKVLVNSANMVPLEPNR